MNTSAYDVARQTFAILLPEILLLATATVMVTAGAFVKVPRRAWCATAAVALGVALIVVLGADQPRAETYGSVVLNDALGEYGRVLFLVTGMIVLALAHDQVDEQRAPEYFASLLYMNAGAMLVAISNELILLFPRQNERGGKRRKRFLGIGQLSAQRIRHIGEGGIDLIIGVD